MAQRLKTWHLGILAFIACCLWLLLNAGTAVAAPDYTYPNSGPNHYVSVSSEGNGIRLNAPQAILKINYSTDTDIFRVNLDDICWHDSTPEIDYASPSNCQPGHVLVIVCPASATDGEINNANCFAADADTISNNQGDARLAFKVRGRPGPFFPLDIVEYNTVKSLYLSVLFIPIGGLNGFKVTSEADRCGSPACNGGPNATYSRVGFGATDSTAPQYPQSLVHLPLTSAGTSAFTIDFKTPCTYAQHDFRFSWFDADRGSAGAPEDYGINWQLTILSPAPPTTLQASTVAGNRGESLEQYLGGQSAFKRQSIRDPSGAPPIQAPLRVGPNHRYSWHWYNVQNNNGVQMYIPFAEPDVDIPCGPLPSPPTCNAGHTAGTVIEPGDTLRAYGDIVFTGAPPVSDATSNMNITVAGPASFGTQVFANRPFSDVPPASGGRGETPDFTVTEGGNYTITVNVTGAVTTSCTHDFKVTNKPYVKIYGDDVFVGFRGCTPADGWGGDVNGNVRGFFNAPLIGSTTQLALMALGEIDHFGSASLRTTTPVPQSGLHFANTVTPRGSFNAPHCPTDFYGQKPPGLAADTNNSINLTPMKSGVYFYRPAGGTLTITAPGGIGTDSGAPGVGVGTKMTIYVDGDVVIDGRNIRYRDSAVWTSTSSMQSLSLRVQGNIKVDRQVHGLDGTYIAQVNPATGSGGTIFTCTNGTALYSDADLFSHCNRQLTVTGALVARTVKLQRTYGSTRNAINYEALGPVGSQDNRCFNPQTFLPAPPNRGVCASEVVNFSPEAYITDLPPSSSSGGFDSIISLPPIL